MGPLVHSASMSSQNKTSSPLRRKLRHRQRYRLRATCWLSVLAPRSRPPPNGLEVRHGDFGSARADVPGGERGGPVGASSDGRWIVGGGADPMGDRDVFVVKLPLGVLQEEPAAARRGGRAS